MGLRNAIVRPMVERWLQSPPAWRSLPMPPSSGVARTTGPDPDRVLLVGSGIAVGYGVDSHDPALAGQLSRLVAAYTGRGADVEVSASPDFTSADARALLDVPRLRGLDAIVATPGGVESLLLRSPDLWAREIGVLLDHIRRHAPASLQVVIVGAPSVPASVRLPRLLAWLAAYSAGQLNRRLRQVCSQYAFTTYVEFPIDGAEDDPCQEATYARWAEAIAPVVGSRLEKFGHPISR